MNRLRDALPHLAPLAIEWAERVSREAALAGTPLNTDGANLARHVGVTTPEVVRIAVEDQLPFPEHPALQEAATQTGLLGPGMNGLTLGHTVFIRTGHESLRLLSHELRHVAQYEAAGSIAAFLPAYLMQILHFGYEDAPFEVDARNHEVAE